MRGKLTAEAAAFELGSLGKGAMPTECNWPTVAPFIPPCVAAGARRAECEHEAHDYSVFDGLPHDCFLPKVGQHLLLDR